MWMGERLSWRAAGIISFSRKGSRAVSPPSNSQTVSCRQHYYQFLYL
jgi:hypothetical protein